MEATVFMNAVTNVSRKWVEYTDIEPIKIIEWNRTVRKFGLDINMQRLQGRRTEKELRQLKSRHRSLINIAEQRCNEILHSTAKSAVFMVTAEDGTVLSTFGQADLLREIVGDHNLGPGTVFDLQGTGINAITVARELNRWVFLNGAEHELKMFMRWSCFCRPIHQDGRIVGYLDLSFAEGEDHVLFATIFDFALRGIEEKLLKQCPDARKVRVTEQLRSFNLTPRELEIGYLWLMNNSVRSIAEELVLAEGTVRLVTKKIYKKTEVSDKGGFLSKFL